MGKSSAIWGPPLCSIPRVESTEVSQYNLVVSFLKQISRQKLMFFRVGKPLITPPTVAPEKWWLEDYFPFKMVKIQGICKLRLLGYQFDWTKVILQCVMSDYTSFSKGGLVKGNSAKLIAFYPTTACQVCVFFFPKPFSVRFYLENRWTYRLNYLCNHHRKVERSSKSYHMYSVITNHLVRFAWRFHLFQPTRDVSELRLKWIHPSLQERRGARMKSNMRSRRKLRNWTAPV